MAVGLTEHELYRQDVCYTSERALPWEKLKGKSILLSGGTGLIGSFLTDVIMWKNRMANLNCHMYILGRNADYAQNRFRYCWGSKYLRFIACNICEPFEFSDIGPVDYVIHLASNTHPVAYASDPVGTIAANILATKYMLEFAGSHHAARALFASSCEIYGENRGDVEYFDELYCGYIDCNTLRAGYPESKRCGEALCQAYIKQKGLDVVIPRFTRTYGPTMLPADTKAISQFIKRGVTGKDIVLKSAGQQYYSFIYVADAVTALLTVLLCGECGNAYNVASDTSDIRLKDLAALVAELSETKVVMEAPDAEEMAGYSTATKCRMECLKLRQLGWNAKFDLKTGILHTVKILRSLGLGE